MPKSKSRLVTNSGAGTADPPVVHQKREQHITWNMLPSFVRNETLEGQEYRVVPMVMLTEGVHSGSEGPLYYPPDELEKTPMAWNHKPIVVYHPTRNGQGISATEPEVLNTRKIGIIMNTRYESGKLKSEAWINPLKANQVDKRIIPAIDEGKMMELSTGVFTDNEMVSGTWNEEQYVGIARNYRADHLALLPDKIGACSIADGAGLLRNQESKGTKEGMDEGIKKILEASGLTANEASLDAIREQLRARVKDLFSNEDFFPFIEDVFRNFFVFEVRGRYFRMNYAVTNDIVGLQGDPVEVVRITEYRELNGITQNTETGDNNMTKNNKNKQTKKVTKEELIGNIVANENNEWAEEDREALQGLSEEQLGKIDAQETGEPAGDDGKSGQGGTQNASGKGKGAETPPAQNSGESKGKPTEPVTVEQYISNAPPEVREVITNSMDSLAREKSGLVEIITANDRNPYSKEELNEKPIRELRALAQLAAKEEEQTPSAPSYFGGQAQPARTVQNEEEPLAVPTMNFEKEKAAS